MLVLFFIIASAISVSAQSNMNCSIYNRTEVPGDMVALFNMELLGNSHIQLVSFSTYNYTLACKSNITALNYGCGGNNISILQTNQVNNSHVSINGFYDNNICLNASDTKMSFYINISDIGGSQPSDYECMFSVAKMNNSHVYPCDHVNATYNVYIKVNSSNALPTLTSVSASVPYVKQGGNVNVTTSGASDADADPLRLECGSLSGASDLCIGSFGSPERSCTFASPWADNSAHTIYCRVFDNNDTSAPDRTTSVTADNTAPVGSYASPTPPDSSRRKSNSETINVSITESGSGIDTCLLEWNGVNESMTRLGSYCWKAKSTTDSTTYSYRVFVNDTANNTGVSATRTFRENAKPSITSVLMLPASPTTNDNLNCSVSGWSDSDGDSQQYYYEWRNGTTLKFSFLSSLTFNMLDSSNTTFGDTWNCSVTPWDGYENGTAKSSSLSLNSCSVAADCESGQFCASGGSCQAMLSNGQNCVGATNEGTDAAEDAACTSGYCDNDGVGSADDGWCFTPFSTYFDGQEMTQCEYSATTTVSTAADEKTGNACDGTSGWINSTCYYFTEGDDNSNTCSCVPDQTGGDAGKEWNIGGEIASTTCCGDDSGEYDFDSSYDSSVDGSPASSDACCNAATDCVHSDACYANNTVSIDVDGDSDNDFCNQTVWYDCKTDSECAMGQTCVNNNCLTSGVNIVFVSPTPADSSRQVGNIIVINVTVDSPLNPVDICTLEWGGVNETMQRIGSGNSVACNKTKFTVDGQGYSFKVYANNTAGTSENTSTRGFTENTKPPAPTHGSPSSGSRLTGNSRTISWTAGGADAEADTITYYWRIDTDATPAPPFTCSGSTTGTSSTPCATADGTTYYWNMMAGDGYENQTVTSAWNFRENDDPSITAVAVIPASPVTADDLNCSVSGWSDSDGDSQQYYYEWRNGTTLKFSFLSSSTFNILDADNTTYGDTWNCSVTPWDGYENGTARSAKVSLNACSVSGDCESGQFCASGGSCQAMLSNGQNCVGATNEGTGAAEDAACTSGYCDNDGVGSADDGWCFTPFSTYFDGQETTQCEYSATSVVSVAADEKTSNACDGTAGWINSTCYYFTDGDSNSNTCSCVPDVTVGDSGKEWGIGGEISAATCCGDDSGEYDKDSSYHASIDSSPAASDACCDAATDCIHSSSCYTTGTVTTNVDGDSDNDYCLSGTWYDCNTDAQCGAGTSCISNNCVSSGVTVTYQAPTPGAGSRQIINTVSINVTVDSPLSNVHTCTLEWNSVNESMEMVGSGTSVTCNKTKLTTDGQTYTLNVWANNSVGTVANGTERSFTENTKPPVPAHGTPANGARLTGNSRTITWTAGGTDAESDTITYYWRIDTDASPTSPFTCEGSTTSLTSIACATADGTGYYWNIIAGDGYENQTVTSAWSFRENSFPSITSAIITPASPYTTDDLTCTVSGWSDADSDSQDYYYEWYRDSVLNRTVHKSGTTDVLMSGNTSTGQTWNCTVIPYDGYENGTAKSDQKTIFNTVPTLTSVSANVSYVRQNGWVRMTTTGASDSDADLLRLECGSSDSASDLCTGSYGSPERTCDFQSSWSDNSAHTVYCRVFDSTVDSTPDRTAFVTSDNTAPTVGAPVIYSGTTSGLYYKGTISINSSVSDTGSGIDAGTCQYSLNNGANWYSASYSAGYCYAASLSPAADITILFRVNDSVGNIGTSSSVAYTYDNTPPSVGQPVIYQGMKSGSYYKGTVSINSTVSDSGVGPDTASCEYSLNNGADWYSADFTTGYCYKSGISPAADITILFRVNDSLANQGTSISRLYTYDNTAPVIAFVSPTPSDADRRFSNQETINVSITETGSGIHTCLLEWNGVNESMTLSGNYCWKSKATSDATTNTYNVYVNDSLDNTGVSSSRSFRENDEPAVSSVVITPGGPYTDDDLTCTVSGWSDADSDSQDYYYEWYRDSVLNRTVHKSGTTDVLMSGNTTAYEDWNCSVIPYDGYENGTALSDNETILNRVPALTSVAANVSYVRQNGWIKITTTGASDTDNDLLRIECGTSSGTSDLCTGSYGSPERTCDFQSSWSDNSAHTVYCRVYDSHDVSTPDRTASVTADNTPPSVGVPVIYEGTTSGSYYKGTISINATVSDTGSGLDTGTCLYSLNNGGSWSPADYAAGYCYKSGISPATDINILFRVNDSVSNQGTSSLTSYTYDNTPPAVTFESPTPPDSSRRISNQESINVSITETGSGLHTCLLEWNGVNESMEIIGSYCNKTKTTADATTYTYRVWANDSLDNIGSTATRTFRENAKPSISSVVITPPTPMVTDDLTCTVGGWSDADADSQGYYYEWRNFSDLKWSSFSASTVHVLMSGNTSADDNWNCTVTPWDGYENGTALYDNVTVLSNPSFWSNITYPVGIYEPYNATIESNPGMYGLHRFGFNITFTNATIFASRNLSCFIDMKNGSIMTVSRIIPSDIIEGTAWLNYTLTSADSAGIVKAPEGYLPWEVKNCSTFVGSYLDFSDSDLYEIPDHTRVHNNFIYVHANQWTGTSQATDDVSTANRCRAGFSNQYFNNTVQCDHNGDTMFAWEMSTNFKLEYKCENSVDDNNDGYLDCSDPRCHGIQNNCFNYTLRHPALSFLPYFNPLNPKAPPYMPLIWLSLAGLFAYAVVIISRSGFAIPTALKPIVTLIPVFFAGAAITSFIVINAFTASATFSGCDNNICSGSFTVGGKTAYYQYTKVVQPDGLFRLRKWSGATNPSATPYFEALLEKVPYFSNYGVYNYTTNPVHYGTLGTSGGQTTFDAYSSSNENSRVDDVVLWINLSGASVGEKTFNMTVVQYAGLPTTEVNLHFNVSASAPPNNDESFSGAMYDLQYPCADGTDNDLDRYSTNGGFDCTDQDCDGGIGNVSNTSHLCEYVTELNCSDRFDNDGNGLVDCLDPDCDGRVGGPGGVKCQYGDESGATNCQDSFNNDFDTYTDCYDQTTCWKQAAYGCAATETSCSNNIDDDLDQDYSSSWDSNANTGKDCTDYDCAGNAACPQRENETAAGVLAEAQCFDTFDNDLDYGRDCGDADCTGITDPSNASRTCYVQEFSLPLHIQACNDAFDNDGDVGQPLGGIDCSDMDCYQQFGNCGPCPTVENITYDSCADGIDNEFDMLFDCEDGNCVGEIGNITGGQSCSASENTNALCSDGFDNDDDGSADCADSECRSGAYAGCGSESTAGLCNDDLDNDGDGYIDCSDSNCFGVGSCAASWATASCITVPSNSSASLVTEVTATQNNRIHVGDNHGFWIFNSPAVYTGYDFYVGSATPSIQYPFNLSECSINDTTNFEMVLSTDYFADIRKKGPTLSGEDVRLTCGPAVSTMANNDYYTSFLGIVGGVLKSGTGTFYTQVYESTAPTVSAVEIEPLDGTSVIRVPYGGSARFRAEPSADPSGICRCTFDLDGTIRTTAGACLHTETNYVADDAGYSVRARADDGAGNSGSYSGAQTVQLNVLPMLDRALEIGRSKPFYYSAGSVDLNVSFITATNGNFDSSKCNVTVLTSAGSVYGYYELSASAVSNTINCTGSIPAPNSDDMYRVFVNVTDEDNDIAKSNAKAFYVCDSLASSGSGWTCAKADFDQDGAVDGIFTTLYGGSKACDNCVGIYNPLQNDADADGIGNDCENQPPQVDYISINSTSVDNRSDGDIILNFSTSDVDAGNNVTDMALWYVNGTSLDVLCLPFEAHQLNSSGEDAWTRDYSNSGSNATVYNALWSRNNGRFGGAYDFDGSSSYLQTPPVSAGSKFTVSAWVKSDLAFQGVLARIVETDYQSHFALTASTSGSGFKFIVNNNAYPFGAAEGGTITAGTWQMVTGTFNGTHGILYVNGQQAASDVFTPPGTVTDDVFIGRYSEGSTAYWDGMIDDVRVFNRSFSAAQVRALYDNESRVITGSTILPGDVWSACVTPNDGTLDGTEACSGTIEVPGCYDLDGDSFFGDTSDYGCTADFDCDDADPDMLIPSDDMSLAAAVIRFCPGNYTLVDIAGDGAIKLGSGRTIDCNGATINGDDTGIGIMVKDADSAVLKDCNIRNYSIGLYIDPSFDNDIQDLVIYGGAYCVLFNESDGNRIHNITAYKCDYGMYFNNSDSNRVNMSYVHDTFRAGIFFNASDYNNVTNTTIENNPYGVYLNQSSTGNLFYFNEFVSSYTLQASSDIAGNLFNTTNTTSCSVAWEFCARGNYWDDSIALSILDSNSDGFGDSGTSYPYNVANGGRVSANVKDDGPITSKSIIDNEPPNATIVIYGPNGTAVTGTRNVFLNLSYADNVQVYKCRWANDDVANLALYAWENCTTVKAWLLSEAEGNKTVYFQVKDIVGLITTVNDSIDYYYTQDYTAPNLSAVYDGISGPDIDWWNSNSTLHAHWNVATDDISDTIYYRYRVMENGSCYNNDCNFTDVGTATSAYVSALTMYENWLYSFDVRAYSFNISVPVVSSNGTRIDLTPPQAPIINSTTHPNPSMSFASSTVLLNWSAQDVLGNGNMSGIEGYSYMIDRQSGTAPDNVVEDSYWETLKPMATGYYNQTLKMNGSAAADYAYSVYSQLNANFTENDSVRVRVVLAEQFSDYADLMGVKVYLIRVADGATISSFDSENRAVSNIANVSQDIMYAADMSLSQVYWFDLTVNDTVDDVSGDIYIVVAGLTDDDDNRNTLAIAGSTAGIDQSTWAWACQEAAGSCINTTSQVEYAIEVRRADPDGASWVEYDGLADGTYYFHVRAKDKAGNWGDPSHFQVNVAAGGVSVAIASPMDGEVITSGNATVNISVKVLVSGNASVKVVTVHPDGSNYTTPASVFSTANIFRNVTLELGTNRIYAVANTSAGVVTVSSGVYVIVTRELFPVTNKTLSAKYNGCAASPGQHLCSATQASYRLGVASEDSEGVSGNTLVADTGYNSIKIFMSKGFDVDDIEDDLDDNEFMDVNNPSFSYGRKADRYVLNTELRYPDIWLAGIFAVTPGKHILYINHNGVTEDGRVNLSIEVR